VTALDQAIRAEALSWQGTPFRHMCGLKHIGVDCIHLVEAVLRAVGLLGADAIVPSYSPDWHLHQRRELLLEGLRQHCDEVEPPYQVGDILVWRYGRTASHCGLYVGDGRLVHAATKDQVRCDPIDSASLVRRFVAAYRVRR
jgi:NlpC/P60 family putative phage cell wall peptidase